MVLVHPCNIPIFTYIFLLGFYRKLLDQLQRRVKVNTGMRFLSRQAGKETPIFIKKNSGTVDENIFQNNKCSFHTSPSWFFFFFFVFL